MPFKIYLPFLLTILISYNSYAVVDAGGCDSDNYATALAYMNSEIANWLSQPFTGGTGSVRVGPHLIYKNGTGLWIALKWDYVFTDSTAGEFITPNSLQGVCMYGSGSTPPSGPNPPGGSCGNSATGSIIGTDDLTLGEKIDLVGIPFDLVYNTERDPARAANRQFYVQLGSPYMASTSDSLFLDITFGGVTDTFTFAPVGLKNIQYTYTWNGLDRNNTVPVASIEMESNLREYPANSNPDGLTKTSAWIGTYNAKFAGLGGWTLSAHHFYDKNVRKLYRGDGTTSIANFSVINNNGDIRVIDPQSELIYTFDINGFHLETRTYLLNKLIYTFSYDTSNRLSQIVDAFSNVTSINRNGSGTLTGITGPYGQTTNFTLNAHGKLIQVLNPANTSHTMTYHNEGRGLIASFKKPTGQITQFQYDQNGRLKVDKKLNGSSLSFEYQKKDFDRTIKMTSKGGRETLFQIIEKGYSSSVIDFERYASYPDGKTIHYDETAGIGQIKETKGSTITQQYSGSDPRFPNEHKYVNYLKYFDSLNHNNLEYSIQRSVTGMTTDPYTYTTLDVTATKGTVAATATFSKSAATWSFTSYEGRTSTIKLDPNTEQVLEYDNTSILPIIYTYNSDGEISTISQNSRTTNYAYSTAGLLNSITNAANEVTTFQHNTAGNLTKVIWPDLREIQYEYDSEGKITSIKPPGRGKFYFAYGIVSEVLDTLLPPEINGDTGYSFQYIYDDDNLLKRIRKPTSTEILYNYVSGTNKISTITDLTLSYTYGSYDNNGHPMYVVSPDNLKTEFTRIGNVVQASSLIDQSQSINYGKLESNYVNNLLMSTTLKDGSGGTVDSYSNTYDDDNIMESAGGLTYNISGSTGQNLGSTLGLAVDTLSYNPSNEVVGYTSAYNGTTKFSYSIIRDVIGRIDEYTENVLGTSMTYKYFYDNSGRLIELKVGGTTQSIYTYDANSNKINGQIGGISFSGTYDDHDRLISFNNLTFTYNKNGELTSKTDTLTSNVTTYTWDSWGKLKKVDLPNLSEISYRYDGSDRRAMVLLNNNIQSVYLYQDQLRLSAELDSSGNLISRFIWGNRLNAPEYMVKNGTQYKFITDPRGSVRLVINVNNGSIAQRIDYNELGKVIYDSNPGFQPFGFAGGLYDTNTGLVQLGARYYDPEVGRWLSKDPIMFNGGDTNLYGYVLNDPINYIDPTGEISVGACVAIGAGIGVAIGPFTPGGPVGGALIGGGLGYIFCPPPPPTPPNTPPGDDRPYQQPYNPPTGGGGGRSGQTQSPPGGGGSC